MAPVHRSLAGDALSFDLQDEMRTVREELGDDRSRVARTLVKEGALRITLVGVGAGGVLREHVADGPVTIHVLEGEIELQVKDESHTLPAGSLVALGPGVRHAVSATSGGFFLLTVAARERGAEGAGSSGA